MKMIKHLKIAKATDYLSYQRAIPKDLRAKAKAIGVPLNIVTPLKLTKADAVSEITKAIETQNKKFEDVCRLLRATNEGDLSKAEAHKSAEALLEQRGVPHGALINADPTGEAFDATLDDALGIHVNQDHRDWQKVYPEEEKLPEKLVSAVNHLLNTQKGHEVFHLFSDAVEHYKRYKQSNIEGAVVSEGHLKRRRRELAKDLKRLDDFMVFSGNQEFTTDNCNVSLRLYKEHLVSLHKAAPATAKRCLSPAAAALRMFAEEVAINVAITTKLTIKDQRAYKKQREVVDVERELPLLWSAAHDENYDHFFRLHVFGIFSGSHASELVQTDVDLVKEEEGYFILGGTKRVTRTRPVIIINETHKRLLRQFKEYPKDGMGFTSICGPRALQTESRHAHLMKEQLLKATGNPKLTAYTLRHTGKFIGEIKGISKLPAFERMFGWRSADSAIQSDYGRAGIYSDAMLSEYRKLTGAMLEGLPDHNSPTPATAKDNVVKLDKRRHRNDG